MGANYTNFDLGQALRDATQPLNNYAAEKTALTLSDIARQEQWRQQGVARQQQLADVASARDYAQRAADAESARRVKEHGEEDNLELAKNLAIMGVDTTDADGKTLPQNKLLSNYRAFQKTKAENLLSHFDAQMDRNKEAQKDTVEDLQGAIDKAASPETKRRALILTMADPTATKGLTEGEKRDLNKVLLSGGDPDAAVKKVYDSLASDYWVPAFGRQSAASSRASAFYQTYLNAVNADLDKSKQIDIAIYSKRFEDLNKEAAEIGAARDKHVLDYAPFLPKEAVTGLGAGGTVAPVSASKSQQTSVTPPPSDPNDAFKSTPLPGTVAPRTSSAAPSSPSVGQIYDQRGALGVAQSIDPNRIPVIGQISSGLKTLTPGTPESATAGAGLAALPAIAGRALFGNSETQPLTPQQIAVGRAARDVRVSLQSNPSPALQPASAAEVDQVRQLAAQKYGGTPNGWAQTQARIRSGDPQAIAAFNMLLKEVRQNSGYVVPGGNPLTTGIGALAPAGQQ